MKNYINPNTQNIIKNYMSDESYFMSKNKFVLNYLKIGPFPNSKELKVKFASLLHKDISFPNAEIRIINEAADKFFYYIKFNSDFKINFDLSLDVRAFRLKFSIWVNLWFSTLDNISHYIINNKLFIKEHKVKEYEHKNDLKIPLNKATTFVEMKTMFFNYEDIDEIKEQQFDHKNFELTKKSSRHFTITPSIEKSHCSRMIEFDSDINMETVVTPKGRKVFQDSSDNMFTLIELLARDHNINKFIQGVNKVAHSRSISPFSTNDINIFLKATELDKFTQAKSMALDFTVNINFKLVE